MKRNISNSPRLLQFKIERRKILLRKILVFVFLFLVIAVGLSYLFRVDRLKIIEIYVKGNSVVNEEMIKEVVKREIVGNYFWFFPKANILYYPKTNIKNQLENNFKRLKDVTFSIKGLEDEDSEENYLEISVTERTAKYTWCGAMMDIQTESQSKCYFLDEDGYIFDEAPYFSGEVYFKFYGTAGVNQDTLSGSYFSKQNFKQLISFKETLEKMKFNPVALYTIPNGDIKMFLSASGAQSTGPEIIFKADSDFQKIAENLQAALSTEPLKTELIKKYSSLEYIDLRFGNKVYYKFR